MSVDFYHKNNIIIEIKRKKYMEKGTRAREEKEHNLDFALSITLIDYKAFV